MVAAGSETTRPFFCLADLQESKAPFCRISREDSYCETIFN